jgi:hypothetical protein
MLVLTEVPNLGLVAVLQVRAPWNTEKNKPQKFAYGCQVTVHGGLEEGESFLEALKREIEEELGEMFFDSLEDRLHDTECFKVVSQVSEETKEVITYAIKLPFEIVTRIRSHLDAAGFRFTQESELTEIFDLNLYPNRVNYTGTIAMFSDEKQAVERAFELFSKK